MNRTAWPPAAILLAALAGLGFAHSNAAGIVLPWPPNCTIPPRIVLVGLGFAGPDSALGHFQVLVRDNYGRPLPHAAVLCELEPGGDFRIAFDQLDPSAIVVCAQQAVYKLSDENGVVAFTIMGGGRQPLGPPVAANRLTIYADGVKLGSVPCICFDLSGTQGLNGIDLSLWGADFFGGMNPDRSDFDGDGSVTLFDLSRWGAEFFAGTSTRSPSAYCP